MPAQRATYRYVVEALQHRFGHFQQVEMHRSCLKVRVRGRGEPLTQLAQEVESLVHRAYPTAQDMVSLLARDCFIEALQVSRLKMYMKQAHPKDVQEAHTQASEMEVFLRTATNALRLVPPCYEEGTDALPRHVKARRSTTGKTNRWQKESSRGFRGGCWGCGKLGYKRGVWLSTKIMLAGGHQPYALQVVLLELWPNRTPHEGLPGPQRSGEGGKRNRPEQLGEVSTRDRHAPPGLSCCLTTVPTAVSVSAMVNGCSVQLVVETRSEKTVVREDLDSVTMRTPVMVNIGVGNVLERLPVFITAVFIAALKDPCLLGIAFLTHVGGSLDIRKEKLKIRGQELPLILGGDNQCERRHGQQSGVSCQVGEETPEMDLPQPEPKHGQDVDDSDDVSRQSSGSDADEAAVEHASDITMPRRNRRKQWWHGHYVV
ncbi:hypothetical protein E2C01_056166 [Portunus trituberculatus]|uniref:Uncharacterized protein n=1 Tax=Portunus trituberculatus TaxID=210409 RepID=A0A5B7GXF0_PORTR|nr:hypothetical protein [Portunus trituberculatus]